MDPCGTAKGNSTWRWAGERRRASPVLTRLSTGVTSLFHYYLETDPPA